MFSRRGLDPDRVTTGQQALEGGGIGDDAAAGRDDRARLLLDDPLQTPALEAAEGRLPIEIEDRIQRRPCRGLYFLVELDERTGQAIRQHGSQCGLSSPPKADQRHAVAAALRRHPAELLEQHAMGRPEFSGGQAAQEFRGMCQLQRRLGAIADQPLEGRVQRGRQLPKQEDGDVPAPCLELAEITLGNA